MPRNPNRLPLQLAAVLCLACSAQLAAPPAGSDAAGARPDVHSFRRAQEPAIEHLALDLTVDFDRRVVHGRASLRLASAGGAETLHLDTRGLDVRAVHFDDGEAAAFELGDEVPLLGRPLRIELAPGAGVVHVDYATRPGAAALLWLDPAQTAGGEHPFLFSQSQAILARTWVPCQDTPSVRFTYDATVRVPPELLAVMSAEGASARAADGVYRFRMEQPIPSYLLALAVGDLEFRALGPRTGVYAEPAVVGKAAWEFAGTEQMMAAVEALYGPYRWGRYDILVLPPSFPFGGMENPRMTFATPTILAGDRSLVSLVAHELAHSWSGNLVTNATWNDFWLNEGFTTYLELRIMEEVHGEEYAAMLALLGRQDLERELEKLPPRDTHLHLDLAGRDPEEGLTTIAYEKGHFFLRALEEAAGRERFDEYLRGHFDRNAFRSLTTAEFVEQLRGSLLADLPEVAAQVAIDDWIYGPGIPGGLPEITSEAFAAVDAQAAAWEAGTPASELDAAGWHSHQWLRFVRALPAEMGAGRMAELDGAFGFTASGNSEVLSAWLLHAVANRYQPAYPALEDFLTGMGRLKFLRPLYQRLAETEDGLARARRIYAVARPSYHSMATGPLDALLGWQE